VLYRCVGGRVGTASISSVTELRSRMLRPKRSSHIHMMLYVPGAYVRPCAAS
jgi:hypothetical protein